MKTALVNTLAAGLVAVSSFAVADDNNGGKNGGDHNSTLRMNDSMKTDPDTTGSIKCDNSNANVNSGCDKPGHLKQEERMQDNQ